MMGFHEFEKSAIFSENWKNLEMVKSARSSSREKLAFTSLGTKPAGGELVLD